MSQFTSSPAENERVRFLLSHLNRENFSLESLIRPPYSAILLHSSGSIIAGNQGAADIIRCSKEGLLGLNAWTLFPAGSIRKVMENLSSMSEEPYQIQAQRTDGELFMIELKAVNLEIMGEPVRAILMREL